MNSVKQPTYFAYKYLEDGHCKVCEEVINIDESA